MFLSINPSITNDYFLRLVEEIDKLKEGKAISKNALGLVKKGYDAVNKLHLSTNCLIEKYENEETDSTTKELIKFNISFEKM